MLRYVWVGGACGKYRVAFKTSYKIEYRSRIENKKEILDDIKQVWSMKDIEKQLDDKSATDVAQFRNGVYE